MFKQTKSGRSSIPACFLQGPPKDISFPINFQAHQMFGPPRISEVLHDNTSMQPVDEMEKNFYLSLSFSVSMFR